uniref:SANT domain-containing protein n=1 Tax=Lotharella oceanica TaxID=641309 RepID=A0A7S2XHH7_9EUKA
MASDAEAKPPAARDPEKNSKETENSVDDKVLAEKKHRQKQRQEGHSSTSNARDSEHSSSSGKQEKRKRMRLWDGQADEFDDGKGEKRIKAPSLTEILPQGYEEECPPPRRAFDDFLSSTSQLYYTKCPPGDELWQAYSSGFEKTNIPPSGQICAPLRPPRVWESWSPYDIAIFEAGVCANGKLFHKVQKLLPHKTVNEIVTMFYAWKASSRYYMWKKGKRPVFKVVGNEKREEVRNLMKGFEGS